MKPQFSCLAMCGAPRAYGAPWLVGAWRRPENVVRLIRLFVGPILLAIAILAVTVALLLGGRSLVPFVIGGGIGPPGQVTSMSAERVCAERDLQAETARLLASFETSEPLPADGEFP